MVSPQPVPPTGQPLGGGAALKKRPGIRWKFVLIIAAVGAFLVIGALYGLSALSKVNVAGTFGVPQDFPVYPGARLIGVRENVGTEGTRVDASWQASDSVDTVTAFYVQRLNQAPWHITRTNRVNGSWEFNRTDGTKTRGIIQLSGQGQQTRIDMSMLK